MSKKNSPETVTPFDWQCYTAPQPTASAAVQRRKPAARRERKQLTVRERVEQILAHRWGNPYCKPGAA